MPATGVSSSPEHERAIMRSHDEGGARRRPASVLRWAERLFVIGGAAVLAWCAVVVTDAYLTQRSARQSLETISRVAAPALPRVPATPVPKPRSIARRGTAIAALSIPRVDLSAIVLHGSDDQTLRRGPGHLENTAMPGEAGNAVIAGHRDTFFRPLRNVRLGDEIFVDTPRGRVEYRVTSLRVVHPRDISVLEPTDDEVLTLITCYPFTLLGRAPDRFIVRATRVAAAVAAAPAASPPSPFTASGEPYGRKATNATVKPVTAQSRVVPDDETLIREAIERFRITYNARLISRNDRRPGGPLTFRACDITIDIDQAATHCGSASDPAEDSDLHVWTMTLRRTGDGWAITRITSPD